MKLQFLGTGAAEGTPAVFCQCPTCKEARRRGQREYHTRAQFLIDDTVGIDFPPDAYAHALRFDIDLANIRHLLVTHSHMDHFYAHDFILRGYKYCSPVQTPLIVYGNAEVKEVFDECTRRELREEVAENIQVRVVQAFQPFTFEGYRATPLLAQHSKAEEAFVYLVEKGEVSYLHLTDTGRLPAQTLDFLEKWARDTEKRVDFVTFDCTFLFHTAGEVSRHMGLEDNKAMQAQFLSRGIADGDTKFAITHYSHNNNPLSETLKRAEKEYDFLSTHDGMSVFIKEK